MRNTDEDTVTAMENFVPVSSKAPHYQSPGRTELCTYVD